MLNKIIKFSLNNRLLVLAIFVLLMVGGIYTSTRMSIDVFPDLNAPTVVVMTEAQGMASEEVERLVTFPVETAVNGATHVRRVRSSSTMGFSVVWVEFDWGTDIYKARQMVSEKLTALQETFPSNVGRPILAPQSSILGEMMFVAITSDTTSLQRLRTLADWTIRPRLMAQGGVAQVSVIGGDIKEYQILLNPEKMKHYGVSLNDVTMALQKSNQNVAGGILNEYGNEYIIRGMLSTSDIDELGASVVKSRGEKSVLLYDVAKVKVGSKKPQIGLASYNAHSAVVLTITKQPNIGTLELTERLDKVLEELQKEMPQDVRLVSDVYRQSRFIENSIGNVQKALLEGAFFVVVVLFLFLMNVRTTLISLVTIPLSLLISILILQLLGQTINTMSLGGMCIAIGSLVDDAIVDVENVFRHLYENHKLPSEKRLPVLSVIYKASCEVRWPILNSTLIIVASFLPLFFLSGMEGRMLKPLGITFIVALGASTIVALTLTPVLCHLLLGRGYSHMKYSSMPQWVVALKKRYYSSLLKAVRHWKAVVVLTFISFLLSVGMFPFFGRSFLPAFNEGSFTININTLPGVSLDVSNQIGRRAEELLLSIPEIQHVGRKTGRAELDEHALGVNNSEIEAPFVLEDRSKDEVLKDVRQKLSTLPGVSVEVGSPISHRMDAMLSGTRAGIAIKLFGTDLNKMYNIGNQIKETILGIDGVTDLNVEQQVERPQLKIIPKREILKQYGITMPEFAEVIRVALAGENVSQVNENGAVFDLTLKVSDEKHSNMESIKDLMVNVNNVAVPLGQLAKIESTSGPNIINRENLSRKIVISANVVDRDLRGVVDEIQKKVEQEVTFPKGYHVEYGGQFESEQSASRVLFAASLFSIFVIFMLLYNQFHNVSQSLVVLLNLPLALIGGIWAIGLSGGVVSIPSIIGFISLFGIATRNGLLLISHYNALCESGVPLVKSVIQGSMDRLNPILMTALSSALALIPMILGGDLPGNEIQSPMAKVILGGLCTSTLLNGFVIPIVYLIINNKSWKKENLK